MRPRSQQQAGSSRQGSGQRAGSGTRGCHKVGISSALVSHPAAGRRYRIFLSAVARKKTNHKPPWQSANCVKPGGASPEILRGFAKRQAAEPRSNDRQGLPNAFRQAAEALQRDDLCQVFAKCCQGRLLWDGTPGAEPLGGVAGGQRWGCPVGPLGGARRGWRRWFRRFQC